jgi:hypothetical protein
MEKIIPRWEWRTFGESFGEADAKYAALTPNDVQESDELYFLSTTNDENVKVRYDLMDIKTLVEVNADGLEQWKPVLKASFPLPAAEAKSVLEALGVQVPALHRAEYTLDQFVVAAVGLGAMLVRDVLPISSGVNWPSKAGSEERTSALNIGVTALVGSLFSCPGVTLRPRLA